MLDGDNAAEKVKRPQHQESPRAASKGASSSAAYEDIDECMVDYEEDDE
jgi:hypothetical protein